jgi:CheY-like chemotaxis protein
MPCPNIVVIEDEQSIRESVHDFLESEGYSVASFKNGKEALDGLQRCAEPCLILLDLMMPVMNGFEFLNARSHINDRIAAIPVVIVSAMAEDARGKPGVRGFVKKPVDIDVLLKLVRNHCGCPAAAQKVA